MPIINSYWPAANNPEEYYFIPLNTTHWKIFGATQSMASLLVSLVLSYYFIRLAIILRCQIKTSYTLFLFNFVAIFSNVISALHFISGFSEAFRYSYNWAIFLWEYNSISRDYCGFLLGFKFLHSLYTATPLILRLSYQILMITYIALAHLLLPILYIDDSDLKIYIFSYGRPVFVLIMVAPFTYICCKYSALFSRRSWRNPEFLAIVMINLGFFFRALGWLISNAFKGEQKLIFNSVPCAVSLLFMIGIAFLLAVFIRAEIAGREVQREAPLLQRAASREDM